MASSSVLSNGVAWQPWGSAAFTRAREEAKPVLLSIAAAWCRWCHEMDRTSYADRSIVALINERFVPIRVDADDRPDISERYSLGGWPTTAFLNADGEILAGGTFVPLERMSSVLAQVADAFNRPRPHSIAHPREPIPATTGPARTSADLTDDVFAAFDETSGGFGDEPKFPLTAPLHLALELFNERRDSRMQHIVVASLDAMGWSALYDDVDGGFFRYATTRDWQQPHFEKLLDVNAALTRVYLEAGAALQTTRFTERAGDTLRYLQTWLADPVEGGWYGSQQADERYYSAHSIDERRVLPHPPVAETMYADANAAMVSTAFEAARVFGDDGLREFALKSLERVLMMCYRPGQGVAHYSDGEPRVRGLLADQIAMTAACLDAFDLTENVVYEMMAEELGHYAARVLWDARDGGFFDRAHDEAEPTIGLLNRPLKPFVTNCDAARTLHRLAETSGEMEFARLATHTLQAMAPLAAAQGPLAAHYLLALRASGSR
jgi:uncharacterized protein YyaL (SSP411 family)